MRKRVTHATVLAAAFSLAAALLLMTGCFGVPAEKLVAAYVNSDKIYEDDVTEYIEGFRANNQAYETDTGWAEFLNENGMTAEGMRKYVLDETFIPKVLIRQQCETYDIALTDSELDEVIEREKKYYEQRYGANSWDSVLSSFGYTEQTWRENEADRLLEEQLKLTVVPDVTPNASDVQLKADETASNYNGKHSYYQAYATEQEAKDAQTRIPNNDGVSSLEDFQRVAPQAISAGWSSLTSDKDNMTTDYVQALNGLELGHVSEPVKQGDSYVLIFCDQVFDIQANSAVDLAAVPQEIYDQLVSDTKKSKQNDQFNEWMNRLKAESSIVYEPMPSGLPYDVNVSITE